ncbi:MAG: hypothetical protein ACOVOE_15105 [Caulobacter sp.]
MSFQKMDRNFQSKKGKSFHAESGHDDRPFVTAIAKAMLSEWGDSPSARKAVGRITSANERTVRNWFEGRNGPTGENLVALIRHSDAVFETILALSGRQSLLPLARIVGLRDRLNELVLAIDELTIH